MGHAARQRKGGTAMTRATHRITLIVLVLVVCAGPWGCALKHPPGPQSPADEVRAQLNTIGLPVAGFAPETHVDAPTSGKGMGALKGVGYGFGAGAMPGKAIVDAVVTQSACDVKEISPLCLAVAVFGIGMAAAGGTIGALGGTVYGAVTAESGSKIDAAQADLKSAVIQADIQMMVRDQVLQIVRDRSSLNFVAVDDQERSANAERIDYQALASTGIDTVLEVSVPRLGLVGQFGINPPVSLFMTARARLVRTADGAEMYAEKFDYHGGGASKFLEWAADDGQMFRQEVDRGTRSLADDIVRRLSWGARARHRAPAEQQAEPPSAPVEVSTKPPAAPPAASEQAGGTTASSDPPAQPMKVAAVDSSQSTPVDLRRLAVLGTWQGTFRPADGSRKYPVRLRIFEDGSQLRWELTRTQAGQDLAGAGGVSVADATVTLTGRYQPSLGSVYQRAWTGSQSIDVTYSLKRDGASLVGSGLGADNRVETLILMRAPGQ